MAGPNELEPVSGGARGGAAPDPRSAFARLPGALQALQDKAVGEAVAQAEGLLRDHYALYHRTTAGGGNFVLVESQTMADATATTVTFETIPADGSGLVLVVSAHQEVEGGSAGTGVLLLRLNDDSTTNYWNKYHETYGTTSTVSHQVLGDDASSVPLGRLSFADDTDPDEASGGTVAFFPGHAVDGRRKQVIALGSAFTGKGAGGAHWLGEYGGEWRGTDAITKLTLLPSGSFATFSTGSTFTLYQLTTTGAAAAATPALTARLAALEARVAALEGATP